MKFLLTMPRIVENVNDWYMFPLGIPYISSSMKKHGLDVVTLNLNHIAGNVTDIVEKEIIKNNIDVVLTGGLSPQYTAVYEIMKAAKKVNRNIITVCGGGIITGDPIPAMEALEYVDYGVIGEGEITTCELCDAIIKKNIGNELKGIVYYNEFFKQYIINPPREEITDLDAIPFPDYEGFEFEKLLSLVPSVISLNKKNTLIILGSRSCPFQCTFCFHSSGNKYRQRSLDNFFEELDILYNKYKIKFIFIADELFAHNKLRIKEFCHRIKKYKLRWEADFRVSDIDSELIDMLKDGNCEVAALGLESADNKILKSMKKHITVEQIDKALKLFYDAGIAIQGNFIFGDIEETVETAKNTLNYWKENVHYGIELMFIRTYPGTYLYKYACKNNLIKNKITFLKEGCPMINLSKMNKSELQWLANEIVTLPVIYRKKLSNIEKNVMNENFTINVTATCDVCKMTNEWLNIRLFTRNQLVCAQCGTKFSIPVNLEIKILLEKGLNILLKKGNKIAFWCMPDFFIEYVAQMNSILNEKVFFIDNSEIKQGMEVINKKIQKPEVIINEKIDMVIVSYPNYFIEIKDRIKNDFDSKVRCISINDLIQMGYEN